MKAVEGQHIASSGCRDIPLVLHREFNLPLQLG